MSNDSQEVLLTLKFQGKTPSSLNLQTNTHTVVQQQTPLNKGTKRGCAVLSPVNEISLEPAVVKSIEESIQKSITGLIPVIMETIRSELRVRIDEIVDKKVGELRSEMQCELDIQAADAKLKTLSETEILETYNRRDNIKIIGLQSIQRETYEETANLIRELTSEMNVQLDERDISIAHRLPSKSANKPVIVKFTRRAQM